MALRRFRKGGFLKSTMDDMEEIMKKPGKKRRRTEVVYG
jgi:hypothetical protein